MSSRAAEAVRSVPTGTLGIVGLCCVLHVLQLVLNFPLHQVTLCPRLVIYLHEYYRVITSALFHGGFMHIAMNMMSTMAISSLLEKRSGTLYHILATMAAILLTSTVYIGFAVVLSFFGNDSLLYQHSIGFSGVIFHFAVLESNLGPHRSRSVFGFFSVPSYLYPWVLLVLLQCFMPNLSFAGHLAGITTGTLHLYGMLNFLLVVDEAFLREMESWKIVRWVSSSHPGFVPIPASIEMTTAQQGGLSSLGANLVRGGKSLLRLGAHVVEAAIVIVFGRGSSMNANIQLQSLVNVSEANETSPNTLDDDDDNWNGLPEERGQLV